MALLSFPIIFEGLGFTIRGGTDHVHIPGEDGVFVTSIKPNGAAARDGRLQQGDKILEVYMLWCPVTQTFQ